MTMQTYGLVPSRNLIRAELKMLKYAEPVMALGSFGMHTEQPLRSTDTIVFRRLDPFNAGANGVAQITPANFQIAEGSVPDSHSISYTNVSVTLLQWAVLFKLTSKAALMYEDDIPADMIKLTGKTMGEVAELIAYGEFKAPPNVVYANGSTRAGINTPITLDKLRLATRTLENNLASRVTSRLKSGLEFGTESLDECFVAFCHTDHVSDIQDLPHFKYRHDYGPSVKPVHEREFGSVGEYRFISSPLFRPYLAAGSAVLNGMVSAGGANVDVYTIFIMAEEAWGHVSLKGHGRTSISPTYISPFTKNQANPSGTFGYVGADFWYNCVRTNDNWTVAIETGVRSLG